MLKFNPIPGIEYRFPYAKFRENQSKLEAMTVLPFFRQYGRRDVILPAKSLKTEIYITKYLVDYLLKVLLKSESLSRRKAWTKMNLDTSRLRRLF